MIVVSLLVAVAAAAVTVVVARSSPSTAGSFPAAPPAGTMRPAPGRPSAGLSEASRAPAAGAESVLARQASADTVAVEATVGSWVPQLSAKKIGLVADGRTYDAAAILADHRRLRDTYPDALLVWSGDYSSFRGGDFWITVVDRPVATAEQANDWCARAGLDGDHCYAKRLAHTGGYAGNTRLRASAAGGVSTGTG